MSKPGKNIVKINIIILFILGSLTFWSLRIYYWKTTFELPFADMMMFEHISHNIVNNFDYSWTSFWKTFNPPTLVSIRAFELWLFGESILNWQIFQTFLMFVSLLFLIYEIYKKTKIYFYSVFLLFIVSLSKSSIFWSLKISRESLAETLLYLSIAITFYCFRKKNYYPFLLAGLIYIITIFNRQNFILIIPIFMLLTIFKDIYNNDLKIVINKDKLIKLLFYTFGLLIIWAPWTIRSVILYGHPVLLTTQSPYGGFLWELGEVNIIEKNGNIIKTDVMKLLREAPEKFKNDYEASTYANYISKLWIKQNLLFYLKLSCKRFINITTNRDIYLTKVNRQILFSSSTITSIINNLLIDKYLLLIITGFLGYIILTIKWTIISIIPLTIFLITFSTAFVIGLPRMFEPFISLTIFGNIAFIKSHWNFLEREKS